MQATFDFSESKPFRLDVDGEELFAIEDLEYDTPYDSTLSFKNTTGYPLTLTLDDVEDLLDDSRLYDSSELTITEDGKELYSGPMDEARFAKAFQKDDSADFTFTYRVSDEHVPDNSMMGAEMHARFHFQAGLDVPDENGEDRKITAEVDRQNGKTQVNLKSGNYQTGDTDYRIYLYTGAAAVLLFIIILILRRKRNGKEK